MALFALTLARGAGEAGRHTGSCWASVGVTRRQRSAHPGQLLLGSHLLGDQRGLDPVEQALEPADKLSLRDPQLGVARCSRAERQRDPVEFLDQLRRQTVLEFVDRAAVNLSLIHI